MGVDAPTESRAGSPPLLDLRSLAVPITQVVELGPPNISE